MAAISAAIAEKFCDRCRWTHELWQTAIVLLDRRAVEATRESHHDYLFYRIHRMLKDSFLLEIEKLHDPVVMSGRVNMTLGYILEYGGWDTVTRECLESLIWNMNKLHELVHPARNRILAHNDLQTIINESTLGGFPLGMDVFYFDYLQNIADIVSTNCLNKPFWFAEFPRTDAEDFLRALVEKGLLPPLG